MTFTLCTRCETAQSCSRDSRCYTPSVLETAIREVQEAVREMDAARVRLVAATKSLQLAQKR